MNFFDVLIVGGGLVLGYLVVSMLMGKRAAPPPHGHAGLLAGAPAPEHECWHRVLNVSPDATVDEIRAAHAEMMRQYDAAALASMGSELRALAERKSNEISQAFRRALAAKGETP